MTLVDVRSTRASLVRGAPASADRKFTFAAALQQFEELHRAAASLSAASAPLPLFYALSQAGRAICAARFVPAGVAHDGERHCADWKLKGHGLSFEETTHGDPYPDITESKITVPGVRVTSEGKRLRVRSDGKLTSFLGVSCALGADLPTESFTLGQAAASIDALNHLDIGPPHGYPKPMRILEHDVDRYAGPRTIAVVLVLPDGISESAHPPRLVRRLLAEYPTGSAFTVPNTYDLDLLRAGQFELHARIPELPPAKERSARRSVEQRFLDRVAPRGPRFDDTRWIRPHVGGTTLHPLMAWWAYLHALSMLARYHPDLWSDALDVDYSRDAVALELSLQLAVEDIPDLLFTAIAQSDGQARGPM